MPITNIVLVAICKRFLNNEIVYVKQNHKEGFGLETTLVSIIVEEVTLEQTSKSSSVAMVKNAMITKLNITEE